MRVAVTGGTGYLGAHMVRSLVATGHQVRMLVPPGDPAAEKNAPLGVSVVTGDLRSATAVTELLGGTDALLHAAGVVGTSTRGAALMWEINAYATEVILTRAIELGLDPVVSVSSYSALFPPPDGVITRDSPTAPGRSAYAMTKAYADRVARRSQDGGAPVVVTYPSSVVGAPWGTAVGVTERGWAPITRWGIAPRLRGGMQMIDVRDVAEVHTRLMTAGRGPRRYVCGGTMLPFDDVVDALEEGLGRPIRRVPLSPGLFRGIGRTADALGRVLALPDGLSFEAALLLTAATPTDDRATLDELGMTWRSPREAIVESAQRRSVDGRGQQLGDPAA